MAITVKHPFVSTVPDAADTSIVRPSNWNADHTVTGLGTAAELNAGVANGVATLDSGGKVPVSELPAAVLGALSYQGTWNASTNTPTLVSGTGTKGYYYVVSVAGSTDLDGITDWLVGDWAVFNGTVWQQIDNTDAVSSVNGQTGAVVLTTTNIAEGTNEYFTTARARASVSAGTAISYDNSTGVITNSAPDQTVAIAAGTGISTSGTYPNFTVTNTAPDQVVALTQGGTTTITGTYPNFTISSADQYVGTVTSVGGTGTVNGLTLTGTVTSTGNLTLGGTLDLSAPPAIGGTTPSAGHFTDLSLTGTFKADNAEGTSGQVLTSNGAGNTPKWTTPTTGTVTSVTGTAPVVSSGGATPAISMAAATTSVNGYLTSTDWNTFNGKAPAVTYTTSYVPYGQGTTTPAQSSNFTFASSTLTAPIVSASNGLVVNSNTVSASYSIPSGSSASSVGPMTVASGQTVTVPSGSRWVVL